MMSCTVVALRADRTPGEQAQGAYTRALRELCAADPQHYKSRLCDKVLRARVFAWRIAADALRCAASHTQQGLVTEHFSREPMAVAADWPAHGPFELA